jgi:hypothetical protein
MSKQERLILAVAAVILLLGAVVIFRSTSINTADRTIEPIPAPVAGEPTPPSTDAPAAPEKSEEIDVRSYKGRILPFCGLNENVRIYFQADESTDSGDKLLDCRSLRGNAEDFGWPTFLVKEGEADSEWLALEPKSDMHGIEFQSPAEIRYVKREEVGTPSMLVEGERRWPLELAWATIAASGSIGLMDGFEGWCEHRDQALRLGNLPQNFTIETLIRQRGEDDCAD